MNDLPATPKNVCALPNGTITFTNNDTVSHDIRHSGTTCTQLVGLHGRFRVTSDAHVLESSYTGASLHGGVRLLLAGRWEGVAEVDWYPNRLVHPSFKVGYVFP